jgi:hypothetical protein
VPRSNNSPCCARPASSATTSANDLPSRTPQRTRHLVGLAKRNALSHETLGYVDRYEQLIVGSGGGMKGRGRVRPVHRVSAISTCLTESKRGSLSSWRPRVVRELCRVTPNPSRLSLQRISRDARVEPPWPTKTSTRRRSRSCDERHDDVLRWKLRCWRRVQPSDVAGHVPHRLVPRTGLSSLRAKQDPALHDDVMCDMSSRNNCSRPLIPRHTPARRFPCQRQCPRRSSHGFMTRDRFHNVHYHVQMPPSSRRLFGFESPSTTRSSLNVSIQTL